MIDSQSLCTKIKSEPIDSSNDDEGPNNNDSDDDRKAKEEDANNNCESIEEAAEITAKLAANARAAAAAAFMPGHVTFEALENTKVAIAQFAANALANPHNEAALKELAMLQSTLFTLQHQQVLQLQLIQQLQSHLTMNQQATRPGTPDPSEHESEIEDEDTYERDERENLERRKRALDPSNIPLCPNSPRRYGSSDIITEHDPPPPMGALNSLEMLQKRTQEVLDSASQGILSGNLADELTLDSDSQSGSKDPLLKHRCRYCGKIFGSDSALQIHLRSHTGERPFKCNVCGSRFTTKGNLKVHYQRHSSKFPHVPMNQHPIPEHLDKYHPPLLSQLSPPQLSPNSNAIPVPCSIAFPGLPFYPPSLAMISAPQHSIFGPTSMGGDENETRAADLRKSNKTITTPSRSPSPPVTSRSTPKIKSEPQEENERLSRSLSPCQQGSDEFPTPSNFDESSLENNLHTRTYRDNVSSKSLPLPHCSPMSSASSTTGSMFNHHLPIHPALLPDSAKDPVLYTSLLPRPGSNDNSWESLIEITKSSETAKLQQLVDNLENKITDPNECIVCHRVLSCKSALQMHYRTHTGERPFRCRICGRAFTTKGNLKTHMGVHRMKPPMRTLPQCPVCHKKFTNALVLQQHIRLHTGEPTDLTPEQISASEVRDFPTIAPGHFPLGINPFAMSMHGMHSMRIGSESSQGDNDEYLDYDDDFDDTNSFMDDGESANGSISERLNSGSRQSNISALENQVKTITSMASQLSAGNFKRSSGEKSPSISSSGKRSRPSSPTPSELSTVCALDLTPKSQQSSSTVQPSTIGMVPSCSITHGQRGPITLHNQTSLPPTHFNPLGPQPVRGGNSTCNICFKTFACHSALEIHYRSHTKERPFKCTICDRGFSTKGNMKQHMLTHKIRDIPQHMFNSANSNSNSSDLNHNNRMEIKMETVDRDASDSEEIDLYNSIPKPIIIHQEQMVQNTKDAERLVEDTEPIRIKVEPEICHMSDDDYSEEDDEPLSKRAAIKLTNSDVFAPHQTDTTLPASKNNIPDSVITKQSDDVQATNKNYRINNVDDPKTFGKETPSPTNKTESQSPRTSTSSPINTKHYCFICRKNFSSTSALHIHNRTHTGDKPFKCNVCQKAFTTKGNLKVHMGTHMWTNGASRRGRRMSLELPLKHPLHLSPQDAAFLQQRPELFYPYVQPHFMNGIHQKMADMNPFHSNYSNDLQSIQLNKFKGYLGLSNFPRLNEINHNQPAMRSSSGDRSISPTAKREHGEEKISKQLDSINMKHPTQSEILKT